MPRNINGHLSLCIVLCCIVLYCHSCCVFSTINVKGGNELTGKIPSEIGIVTSLQVIDFGENL